MTPGPQLAAGTIAVRIGNETVVWVETTGALHLLDPVATEVLVLLDGDLALAEVTTLLTERFLMAGDRVEEDVQRLVRELVSAEVLAPGSA